MLNTVTTRSNLPHTRENNQQTHFDSVRLLKGDPPGRHLVNHYTRELGVLRNNKSFANRCQDNHLMDVMDGNFNIENNHYGMCGITSDQKFYDPEKVKGYTKTIRFKDPQRVIPTVI